MADFKRWDLDGPSYVIEHPNGQYVEYKDAEFALRSANLKAIMMEQQRNDARLALSMANSAIAGLKAEISELTGEDDD